MKKIREKPVMGVLLAQLVIAFLSVSAVIFTIMLEIPQVGFPEFSLFNSIDPIDYWSDIFFPALDLPMYVFAFLLVFNTLGIFFAFRLSKRRPYFWAIGIAISSFLNIVLIWISLWWVHNALITNANTLRYADQFGSGFIMRGLESWQVGVGAIFTILIVTVEVVWGRRFFTRSI